MTVRGLGVRRNFRTIEFFKMDSWPSLLLSSLHLFLTDSHDRSMTTNFLMPESLDFLQRESPHWQWVAMKEATTLLVQICVKKFTSAYLRVFGFFTKSPDSMEKLSVMCLEGFIPFSISSDRAQSPTELKT